MRVEILDTARRELLEAVDFYNERKAGLGFEFREEVERTLSRIVQFPRAWPLVSESGRRCLTKRFPYGVLYLIEEDIILVVGVMHLSRSPEAWEDRV